MLLFCIFLGDCACKISTESLPYYVHHSYSNTEKEYIELIVKLIEDGVENGLGFEDILSEIDKTNFDVDLFFSYEINWLPFLDIVKGCLAKCYETNVSEVVNLFKSSNGCSFLLLKEILRNNYDQLPKRDRLVLKRIVENGNCSPEKRWATLSLFMEDVKEIKSSDSTGVFLASYMRNSKNIELVLNRDKFEIEFGNYEKDRAINFGVISGAIEKENGVSAIRAYLGTELFGFWFREFLNSKLVPFSAKVSLLSELNETEIKSVSEFVYLDFSGQEKVFKVR